MSKTKNLLAEMKRMVFGEETPEQKAEREATEKREAFKTRAAEFLKGKEKEVFVDVLAADGTLLVIEPAVEEGASVLVEDPEAGFVPAPDGDHELNDGTVITVSEGLITAVVPVEGEETEEEEMSDEQVISKVVEEIKKTTEFQEFTTAKDSFTEAKESLETKIGEQQTLISSQKETIEAQNEKIEKFEEFQKLALKRFEELETASNEVPPAQVTDGPMTAFQRKRRNKK